MNKKPILSIVVPTKDRYFYLKKLIILIDSYKFGCDVEMVIQDNTADNTEIRHFLEENHFDFIVYNHFSQQLPISLNSDNAIKNSSGEYVCFIGDDDGVTRYILEGVRWMKTNEVDVAKPAEVYYIWPDAIDATNVSEAAVVNYKKFTGSVKFVSPYEELFRTLRNGISDRGNMPIVYHGIASRNVLDKIYKICGTYFPGNSPDIANAVALSLTTEKYALVNLPWAIYGSCITKGGGERMPGKKFPPKIKDIAHWAPDAEEKWYNKIPKVAIWVTIWPESAISALISMGREDLTDKFNLYRFYARFLLLYPTLHSYVDDLNPNKLKLSVEYIKLFVLKYVNAAIRRVGWLIGVSKPLKVRGINTINDAASVLEKISDGVVR